MQEKEQKISPIKQRILHFADTLGISKREFYAKIGVSRGTLESKTGITEDVITKFFATYPNINIEWLMTGQGEMLSRINNFATMQEKEQKMYEEGGISYDSRKGAPYYDVDFLGGFDEIFNDQTTLPTCNIVVPEFDKATVWCNVTGHSMEPKINHGDIIALRECTIQDIQYGEIYAVVLDSIRTIKILRRGQSSDTLMFVPLNTPNFEPQEFPVSRIIRVYEVVGSISRFF